MGSFKRSDFNLIVFLLFWKGPLIIFWVSYSSNSLNVISKRFQPKIIYSNPYEQSARQFPVISDLSSHLTNKCRRTTMDCNLRMFIELVDDLVTIEKCLIIAFFRDFFLVSLTGSCYIEKRLKIIFEKIKFFTFFNNGQNHVFGQVCPRIRKKNQK